VPDPIQPPDDFEDTGELPAYLPEPPSVGASA